jgi:hypothetical protein
MRLATYTPDSARMTLRIQTGTDEYGKAILRSLGFSGIAPSAAAADTLAVAQSLGGLLEYSVTEIQKVDTDLVEDI